MRPRRERAGARPRAGAPRQRRRLLGDRHQHHLVAGGREGAASLCRMRVSTTRWTEVRWAIFIEAGSGTSPKRFYNRRCGR